MSPLDWLTLAAALALFVGYGLWRGRARGSLEAHLVAGRSMPWPMVLLSVMATQASAITFLSTPGQGYSDGLRFVQFYYGLPFAMIVLAVTAVPLYHRLKVFTAYEFLEKRFDAKTRSLAAGLFLVQRGMAAGLTIYAPSLVLSVILGWDVRWTCALIGGLVVLYTVVGGSRAVSHTHTLQFLIILATMGVVSVLAVGALPAGVSVGDAAHVAGRLGRLTALDLKFDPNDRYNLWSGLIGGFFLQLAYFGTDQSQVGRYLTGRSVTESRRGLLLNGLLKVPMQFGILALGVTLFAVSLFVAPPLHFNPVEGARAARGADAPRWSALEREHAVAVAVRQEHARALIAADRAHDAGAEAVAAAGLRAAEGRVREARQSASALVRAANPGSSGNDNNYVFLWFVLGTLPAGLIGLVLAAVFAASMNSTSAELNALATTTVVDVWRRLPGHVPDDRRDLMVSRVATVAWTGFALAFAGWAAGLGTLIEAVNILGSLFYGTILGIFLTAFYLKHVGGTAVFIGALVAEAGVIACFRLTSISFLWYNLLGCLLVVVVALALQPLVGRRREAPAV